MLDLRIAALCVFAVAACERPTRSTPPTAPSHRPAAPDAETPAAGAVAAKAPTQPDVAALQAAALAAAHTASVEPTRFGPGPVIGAPQPGRRRMPWTTVLYKGLGKKGQPYLVDKAVTYFAQRPSATLSADGKLVLRWRTRTAAPGGIVYMGVRVEADPLAPPRFRNYASEEARRPTRVHTLSVDASALLSARYDVSGVLERGYGEFAWQVEQFVPEVGTTVQHEGRTAFRLEGEAIVQQPTIVLGPLVHQVGEDRVVVSFETDVPTGAAVAVGGRLPKVSTAAGVRHEVAIEGLQPNTRYAYQVAVSDGAEASVAPVREVSTRAKGGPVVVAIMSDSRSGHGAGAVNRGGVNAATLRGLLSSAHRGGAQAIIFAGDLINGYSTHPDDYDYELRNWLRVAAGVGGSTPIYTGIGNHESIVDQWSDGLAIGRSDATSAEARFAALMANPTGAPPPEREGAPPYDETVYAFDLGRVHFVMLNTNYWFASKPGHERLQGAGNREGVLMDGQLAWLERDLEAARGRKVEHIVVVGHEPAFPAGGHAKDAMWWGGKLPEVNAMRERFWTLLATHGVLAYVSGDEHNYSRGLIGPETVAGAPGSVYSVITGGCGAPYYAADAPAEYAERIQAFSPQQHYTLWTFEPGEAPRLTVVGLTGEVIEDVALTEAGQGG